MNDTKIFAKIINDSKLLINKEINIFLYCLILRIFLKKRNKRVSIQADKKLKEFIDKINKEMIKDKDKEICEEYTIKNLKNIIDFVKTQNMLFSSEIIENILIIIFSYAFRTEKNNSFTKFIYNNMDLMKRMDNSNFINWLLLNKFKKELSGENAEIFKEILKNESSVYFINELYKKNILPNQPIISFLFNLNNNKLEILDTEEKDKKISMADIMTDYKKSLLNSYTINNYLLKGGKEKVSTIIISLFKILLISVYIYYQNKNSPLMKYIHKSDKDKKLSIIPFEYNLSEAAIDGKYSNVIFSPIRIEPRIEHIKMSKNFLKENSLLEFSKVLLFNKNIKKVDFHVCILNSDCIYYLNSYSVFNNYSIEELNISFNYLREDSSEFLAHLLLNLKNLKTIILSSNELKSGISSFLIVLKNLYRKQKAKLESLYLNKCYLDDIAFYELGELLKNKYCKLKNLYLNNNNIPSTVKFLKKLKKNNSLIKIYFKSSNIGNMDADEIMKVISNSRINSFYLYNNKLSNFSHLIRIIYRTKLIKSEEGENLRSESYFYNLDLSNNQCYNKNKAKIDLFKQAIKETTLYCLDFCHILYNSVPSRLKKTKENEEYTKAVDSLTTYLTEEKNEYNQIAWNANCLNIDIKKIK